MIRMEPKEKMDYEALRAILDSKDDFRKRATFGTTLPQKPSVIEIADKAVSMIAKCTAWVNNWEIIQEGIAPELEEVKLKMLEDKLSRLSETEIDIYLNYLLEKKAKMA